MPIDNRGAPFIDVCSSCEGVRVLTSFLYVPIVLGRLRVTRSGALPLPRPACGVPCVGYVHPTSLPPLVVAGVRTHDTHDVWSTFDCHRRHRLLSSGVQPYRARYVATSRKSSRSSLLIFENRIFLLLRLPRCLVKNRTSSMSLLELVRDRTLWLKLSLRCEVSVSRSSLSSLEMVGDRTRLLAMRCGQLVRPPYHHLLLLEIGPFC